MKNINRNLSEACDGTVFMREQRLRESFSPPSFQKLILLTLTTSSSVERHVAASETSVTEPSVPTVTTFTGTATVFPVNTAVFRISQSWRYKKKTEIKAKKRLESNSLEMKVNHLWINLQTNNWWISYLILSYPYLILYLFLTLPTMFFIKVKLNLPTLVSSIMYKLALAAKSHLTRLSERNRRTKCSNLPLDCSRDRSSKWPQWSGSPGPLSPLAQLHYSEQKS